jgi:small subunit ribosomal protein S8
MSNDTIADLLTRIRNGQRARHGSVLVPITKLNRKLLEILSEEGFIGVVEEQFVENGRVGKRPYGGLGFFKVEIGYYSDGEPLIREAFRVSKSGKRVYSKVEDLGRVKSGLGLSLVSTSQGIMTDREALKRNIGGEVLASIF